MQQNERMGLLYGALGFALFPVGDTIVKSMSGQWAPIALAGLRYFIAALGLGLFLALREGRRGFALPRPGIQIMRGVGVGCAAPAFFTAVMLMPLAEATAITFTQPMLTGLLAALFLREPARKETWIATFVAFTGVLVIIRPSLLELGWVAFLPLISALGMSLTMIGNRMVAHLGSPIAMQFAITAIATVTLGVIVAAGHLSGIPALHVGKPPVIVVGKCIVVAVVLTIGHWLVFKGTTRVGAGTLAPMTYMQLLGATVMGWLAFDDRLDRATLLGMGMIVAAGLYMWWNGRMRDGAELP